MVDRRWSEMVPDVLEAISDRLALQEFVTFRGVCRRWRSAPSGRSAITDFPKDRPWLMFYGGKVDEDDDGAAACYLYNCHRRGPPNWCIFRLPDLRGATVTQSKSGWLFARRGDRFFLYNPLTLAKMDLPDHRVYEDQVCTMSTDDPTARDSYAFVVSRKDGDESGVEVSSCRTVGDSGWERHAVQMSKDRFGTLSAVYERREDRSLVVFGYGGKDVLVYDYTTKTSVIARPIARPATTKASAEAEIKDLELQFLELGDTYDHKNWLQMFGGGDGIKISTCPLSMRLRGVGSVTRVVTRDRQHDDIGSSNAQLNLKLVKATWIEPNFKQNLSLPINF